MHQKTSGTIHSSALHDNPQLATTQRFSSRMAKLQDIHTTKYDSENQQNKTYKNVHKPHPQTADQRSQREGAHAQ